MHSEANPLRITNTVNNYKSNGSLVPVVARQGGQEAPWFIDGLQEVILLSK